MSSNAALDALQAPVYTTDAEGLVTYYNPAAAALWGKHPIKGTDHWTESWRVFWDDGRSMSPDESSMAGALRERTPNQRSGVVAERFDGTRVRFNAYSTPLFDADGKLSGAINLLVEISDHLEADTLAAKLAAIVASSDDAIVSKSLDGVITSWNSGATRIFGYDASEMIGEHIIRIIPPELHEEERQILARLRRGERIDHYETFRIAKNGRRVAVSLTVSPLRDRFGNIIGASKVARDITQKKAADKLQRLLFRELSHRVKNTLAIIQSIASQSLARARSPEAFVSGFTGRLQALGRAHDVITGTNLQGADLRVLLEEQVLLGKEDSRVKFSGPGLMLGSQAAVNLALIIHELASNARTYGALSIPEGRLSVDWQVQNNERVYLVLSWTERNVANVRIPVERGFGSLLIKRSIEMQGGNVSLDYEPSGITCVLTLPLLETSYAVGAERNNSDGAVPRVKSEELKRTFQGKRILIIEDEALITMDLEMALTTIGCDVVGMAGTLEQARTLIDEVPCDATFLDANLFGKPVDQLAVKLTSKNIPFAFVTGFGRDGLPQAFRDANLITKPFSPQALVTALEELLL